MPRRGEQVSLLRQLGLSQYEAQTLEALLKHGRTTAPNLADATDVPKARIYGVLEELANDGFIKIIPGRPKEYQPKSPNEILDRVIENRRQAYQSYQQEIQEVRDEFISTFEPQFKRASQEITPTEELFYVVDVGEPSESETRAIYADATAELCVLTKSFEYLDAIVPALEDALANGVDVRCLFVHPRHLSDENCAIQRDIVERFRSDFADVDIQFSREPLPWRGTLVDPNMEYETGKAIFLVEEKGVPLHMRQAAVTENGSFVAGMKRYFDLVWEHDSVADPNR